MLIQVEDITAFDNENGKGVLGTVNFTIEGEVTTSIRVWVTIDLDRNAPLKILEERFIKTAKEKLRSVI